MHRVELKVPYALPYPLFWDLFLMHRVELKASPTWMGLTFKVRVPNAPCGVESYRNDENSAFSDNVPNAPCGVESPHKFFGDALVSVFLMHRVELKVRLHIVYEASQGVRS